MRKFFFALLLSLLAAASVSAQTQDPFSKVFAVAYVGGTAANVDDDTRNGLNYGAELHFVLKQDVRFGVDFGLGAGYSSLSLPKGKTADLTLSASVGFTDNKYISGGMIFYYDSTEGNVSPNAYLAFTYPIADRVDIFTRGSLGVFVTPDNNNYLSGRGQVGVTYSLVE